MARLKKTPIGRWIIKINGGSSDFDSLARYYLYLPFRHLLLIAAKAVSTKDRKERKKQERASRSSQVFACQGSRLLSLLISGLIDCIFLEMYSTYREGNSDLIEVENIQYSMW